MIDFAQTNNMAVLAEALRLAGYAAVKDGVRAITDASQYSDATKQAIGRLGEKMAQFNAGTPHPGMILHTIATIGWEDAGITGVTALTTADRAALIGIVMSVSQSIIGDESARLENLAGADTALPEGWNAPEQTSPS